jgi:hypothetical protein
MKTQALNVLSQEAAANRIVPFGFRTLALLAALAIVLAAQTPFFGVAAQLIS